MTLHAPRIAATLASLALVAACGSTSHDAAPSAGGAAGAAGASSAGSGGASTLQQTMTFESAVATAACKVLFSCNCNLVATSMCGAGQCPTTQADCANALQGHFYPTSDSIFHADKAEACLAALAGGGCDIPPACKAVYEATGKPGDHCLVDGDCVAGPNQTAYCVGTSVSCAVYTRAAKGGACSTTCASGGGRTFCNDSTAGGAACFEEDGLRCMNGTCGPPGVAGDPCTFSDLLTGCDSSSVCSLAGQCQLAGTAVGGACMPDTTVCAGATYCAAGGTCQPREPGAAPCALGTDCASGVCHAGQCTGTAPGATGVCTWF